MNVDVEVEGRRSRWERRGGRSDGVAQSQSLKLLSHIEIWRVRGKNVTHRVATFAAVSLVLASVELKHHAISDSLHAGKYITFILTSVVVSK